MKLSHLTLSAACLLLLTFAVPEPGFAWEKGYGSFTGQFVLADGSAVPKILFVKGAATVKDPLVCATKDYVDDSLVVDPKTKGIEHIFVYVRRVKKIHPKLKTSKKKKLTFDQINCRFEPHTMRVRLDQTVMVVSADACSHNTHTNPLFNKAENFLVPPKFRAGVPLTFKKGEILPMKVNCDIHPWMFSYWLVLDHPYSAITKPDGTFTIDKLPVGTYNFVIWHERVGYIRTGNAAQMNDKKNKGAMRVTIESDKTNRLGTIKVPLAKFD